ncbi:hypothetical protein DSCW_01970 [Desulfosarcina widdelii]|uniref:Uncharacterized protein n=1 Tax=Desulfosarcina widdelii TaxID=947919 RepID=A0A5K7YWS7_9BACT|nr:hypothetical protein [Desulfosarcina widdelii]BBO72780.1 hypothetical protein DSCW_01970 [Desulfosarcina widdelii]
MARLRKCKLYWAASETEDIVGYKLYWAKGTTVSYDCESIAVGKVNEIPIPECVRLSDEPVMLGITAVDIDGNESDMTTLEAPFQLKPPAPPQCLRIAPADEFVVGTQTAEEAIELEVIQQLIDELEDDDSPAEDPHPVSERDEEEEVSAQFDIGSLF